MVKNTPFFVKPCCTELGNLDILVASEVEEGDVVLMGTDGIFDNLHDSEA